MSVVGRTTTKWLNSDGLLVGLRAKDEAVAVKTGVTAYPDEGGLRTVVKAVIDLTALDLTNETILDDSVTIPNGAFIEEIEVLCIKETTTSSGTFDLGLVDQDRTTEIDFDGLLANYATAGDGTDLGELTRAVKGGTAVGALVGTKITNTGLLTASTDTAAYTAGVVEVRIYYSIPLSGDL